VLMCIICVDYQKEKLTLNEAWRNLKEMREDMDPAHVEEVVNMLWEDDCYNTHGNGD